LSVIHGQHTSSFERFHQSVYLHVEFKAYRG